MKTVRQEKIGAATLRLVAQSDSFAGLLITKGSLAAQIEGSNAQDVWEQLVAKAREASPDYFGYQGARARFLEHFPGGFASGAFVGRERAYKLKAKALLEQTLPLEVALAGTRMGAAALKVYQATNLLSVFEKAKLAPLLRGEKADDFVRAAARFARGEHQAALDAMTRLADPFESAKWTVATYLPFLWRPDTCMFLKPAVTRGYASRVGHAFAEEYSPQLDVSVYQSLIDLVEQTGMHIADLAPRDNIDLQSFIWIVGEYKAGDGEGPDKGELFHRGEDGNMRDKELHEPILANPAHGHEVARLRTQRLLAEGFTLEEIRKTFGQAE
jgi:hypothetical protein